MFRQVRFRFFFFGSSGILGFIFRHLSFYDCQKQFFRQTWLAFLAIYRHMSTISTKNSFFSQIWLSFLAIYLLQFYVTIYKNFYSFAGISDFFAPPIVLGSPFTHKALP